MSVKKRTIGSSEDTGEEKGKPGSLKCSRNGAVSFSVWRVCWCLTLCEYVSYNLGYFY